MRSLDMDGPFALDPDEIVRVVGRNGAGNYALGHLNKDKRFVVEFVGRDDMNVRDPLLNAAHASNGKPGLLARLFGRDTGARAFKFSYAADAEAAYGKHCRTYHGFNSNDRLENAEHPRPPAGTPAACPICGQT